MNQHTRYSASELDRFVCRLFEVGAVKIDTDKGFKLKLHEKNPTAPLSPLYFNLRIPENKGGPLNFGEVEQIAQFFYKFLRANTIEFNGICPVPHAGDPFAKELVRIIDREEKLSMPILMLNKEVTSDSRRIGILLQDKGVKKGSTILLIDDLVSGSESKIEAIESIRAAEYKVDDCIVFLDREQGGRQKMQEIGVELHAIVKLSGVLEIYKDAKLITPTQYDTIKAYLANA